MHWESPWMICHLRTFWFMAERQGKCQAVEKKGGYVCQFCLGSTVLIFKIKIRITPLLIDVASKLLLEVCR